MRLRPIKNHIIFAFVDEVDSKGQFVQKTDWGLQIAGNFDSSAKSPRWAIVVAVGPEATNVKPADLVLIKPLMWTPFFKLAGDKFWRTDEAKLIAASREKGTVLQVFGDSVVFERLDSRVTQTDTNIVVIGSAVVETSSGKVLDAGPECDEDLGSGVTVYFDDKVLSHPFVFNGKNLLAVEEKEILAYSTE